MASVGVEVLEYTHDDATQEIGWSDCGQSSGKFVNVSPTSLPVSYRACATNCGTCKSKDRDLCSLKLSIYWLYLKVGVRNRISITYSQNFFSTRACGGQLSDLYTISSMKRRTYSHSNATIRSAKNFAQFRASVFRLIRMFPIWVSW